MTEGGAREAAAERREALRRLRWLRARLTESSSRIGLLNRGRPYRDTARRQTLRTIRAQTAAVEGEVLAHERLLRAERDRETVGHDADLLSTVARLLASARSSLELAGARNRWSHQPVRERARVAEELERDHGRDRYLRDIRHAIEETQRTLDATGRDASTSRSGRALAWIELARRSLDLAKSWMSRIEGDGPRPPAPRRSTAIAQATLLAALEVKTDYIAVLTAAAEIFCRY